jgi:hypothetical protein
MIYFKITQTGPDHTGQIDIIENIVSQFDLHEHLINAKGVVNVERVEQQSFCFHVIIVKYSHSCKFYMFDSKKNCDEYEKCLIKEKTIYKKYILQDKL